MATTFVIQNQHGHYWSKQKDWTDGRDRRLVFRTSDKVDVINLVFELSSKDVGLRATHLECEVDDFGNPLVTASDIPLPCDDTGTDGEPNRAEAGLKGLETGAEQPHIHSEHS